MIPAAVLIALVVFGGASFAETVCVEELESRYGTEYSEALFGRPTHLRTLRAEQGSLAERHPEILAELARISWSMPMRGLTLERLQRVRLDLDHLVAHRPDVDLESLLVPIRRRIDKILNFEFTADAFYLVRQTELELRNRRLDVFPHHFWEVVVACMIRGEVHRPSTILADVHPSLADSVFGNREVDVFTRASDGRESWVEFKNWRRFWYRDDEMYNRLITQALAIELARQQLDRPELVERELILRSSLPNFIAEDLKRATGFDRIQFLFLDHPSDPTPYSFD